MIWVIAHYKQAPPTGFRAPRPISRPFGTWSFSRPHPTLKRWAIPGISLRDKDPLARLGLVLRGLYDLDRIWRDVQRISGRRFAQCDRSIESLRKEFRCQDALFYSFCQRAARLQEQHVRKNRHDFFNMMSYEHQGRRSFAAAKEIEELKKMFTGGWVEAGTGFVEDQQAWIGHQGAGNEDALAFPLGEALPSAV